MAVFAQAAAAAKATGKMKSLKTCVDDDVEEVCSPCISVPFVCPSDVTQCLVVMHSGSPIYCR
jgi:hypothetical protein